MTVIKIVSFLFLATLFSVLAETPTEVETDLPELDLPNEEFNKLITDQKELIEKEGLKPDGEEELIGQSKHGKQHLNSIESHIRFAPSRVYVRLQIFFYLLTF